MKRTIVPFRCLAIVLGLGLLSPAVHAATPGAAPVMDANAGTPVTELDPDRWSYAVSRAESLRRGTVDPEGATLWNRAPEFVLETNGVYRAIGLKSFDGLEEPIVRYVTAERGVVEDDFVNIRDMDGGVMRMTLRYRGEWWDGDQAKSARDRQRAEIKGLGPHQQNGETYEYGFTFRTDPGFTTHGRFCHVFQVKATDGDHGAPLVVVTLASTNRATVRYISGPRGSFTVAREFNWTPGEWQTLRIRLKISADPEGELTASVNGDEFSGRTGIPMYRPQSTRYRPKYGLYRGVAPGMRDAWVEHKDVTVRKL